MSKGPDFDQVSEHVKGLKIHAVISGELDADHHAALKIPLGNFWMQKLALNEKSHLLTNAVLIHVM
jgi:hypothetical protein